MINIQQPEDLLSISLYNILSYRLDDTKFIELVKNWDRKIEIEITDFYAIIIEFKGNQIKFHRVIEGIKCDLTIKLSLTTLLDLAYKRISVVKAFLTRKLKIRGVYKVKVLLKFSKIFLDSIKKIAEDPNENYYEVERLR
jgi:putative sterol carrier protein